jgi:hypothetical protein
MMILGLFLSCFCLFPTSKGKFAMFWILFFFKKENVKQEKFTNMLFLMLDPRFKSFHLIFSFVGLEECVSILDEYDRKTLYPMLLKCYHHLHPMTKFVGCVNQITHEDCSRDIFQHIASTSQSTKKLVTRKLLIFRHY